MPKDDWVAAKIAIDGTHFWSQALGDAADQRAVDLALLPSREIVLVGEVVGGLNGASCPATACLGVALLAP